MKAIIILLVAITAIVLATPKAPSPPTWPTAFDASILAVDPFGNMRFFRWFYDSTNNVERRDGLRDWNGDMYWIEDVRDYTTTVNTFMAFQMDEVSCFTMPTNGSLPEPNFSSFQYVGLSLVGFRTCDHWIYNSESGPFFQVWDDSTSGELVRIEIANEGMSEMWTFMEVNIGAQDPNLFVIPAIIESVCNPIGNDDRKVLFLN